MAAEIHDSIAQTLTFVKMRLPLLQDAVAEGDEARSLATGRRAPGGGRRARQPARDRHPLPHAHRPARPRPCAGGAGDALPRTQHHRAGYTNTGAPLSLLSDEVQTEVFHIVQEALANIERHSQGAPCPAEHRRRAAGLRAARRRRRHRSAPGRRAVRRRLALRHRHHERGAPSACAASSASAPARRRHARAPAWNAAGAAS